MNELTLTLGGSVRLVLDHAPPPGRVMITTIYEGFVATVAAEGNIMAYTLPADKMVTVRVDYVDAAGHPAEVDGEVTWDTSAADVATVDPDTTDSQQCVITPGGKLGTAQVTASADADLGTGTRSLVTTLDVTIVAGEAVAGVISPVGEPEPMSA